MYKIKKTGLIIFMFLAKQGFTQTGVQTLDPTARQDVNGSLRVRVVTPISAAAKLDSIVALGKDGVVYRTTSAAVLAKRNYTLARVYAVNSGLLLVPSGVDVQVDNWTNFDVSPTALPTTVWDPVTGNFTAPANGYYNVSSIQTFRDNGAVPADSEYSVKIFKKVGASAPILVTKHSNFTGGTTISTPVATGRVTTTIFCNAGDVLSIWAFQNSGANTRTIDTNPRLNSVSIEQLPF